MKKQFKECSVWNCELLTIRGARYCTAHTARFYRTGSVNDGEPIGWRNHGHKKNITSTYRTWLMMKNRCQNPRGVDYKYYGGRGITVCEKWQHYQFFLEDMGEKPTPLHTIGRVNSNEGYFLGNCRWETREEQSRSRSYCKLNKAKVTSIQTMSEMGFTYREIAELYGVSSSTIGYAVSGRSWS